MIKVIYEHHAPSGVHSDTLYYNLQGVVIATISRYFQLLMTSMSISFAVLALEVLLDIIQPMVSR